MVTSSFEMQMVSRMVQIYRMLRIFILTSVLPFSGFATDYYISNTGNDRGNGTSPATAWRSIERLNAAFSIIKPGDNILFKRGESFFGTLRITVSGSEGKPISFAAYGNGPNPVITGLIQILGWTKKEKNIWQARAALPDNLNLVTIDNLPQQIGRHPNADDADGGYLRYENFNDRNIVIDDDLSNSVNWEGAEIVIRKNHWTAERCRILKHNGNTISFTYANNGINPLKEPTLYKGTKGNGYFFQNDYRTLDIVGEWFYNDSNGDLYVVLNDTLSSIRAAAIDTLVNTGNMSFLTFKNLHFEGANKSGMFNRDGGNITIQHCSFNLIGAKAIHFWSTGNVVIDHVSTNHALSNAIQVRNTKKDNVTVTNCTIKNTGLFTGMGSFFDDRDYKALSVSAANNLLIENNVIDSVGLSGVQFQGNNVLVHRNFINNYCLRLDDGAGIYTFVDYAKENASETFFNRTIKNNIILNGRGAPEGSVKTFKAEGIYTDGRSMNIDILENTIAFTGNKAIACNNPVNIQVRGNVCFDNGGGWGATRGINWMELKNFEVKRNTFYSVHQHQNLVYFSHSGLNLPVPVSIWEAIKLAGDIDSNFYNTVNPVAFQYNYAPIAEKKFIYPSPLTFEHWQEYTGQDAHSRKPFVVVPLFSVKKIVGANLVKNGDFSNDMEGITIYGSGVKGEWDGSEKLTGKGSLKVECTQPQPNRYTIIHSTVGGLSIGKKYRFRFKTFGTSDCGIVKAYLRKTLSPYTTLTPVYTRSFGLGKNEHEFVLTTQASDAMSFVIEVEKNSCTAYIDDIELNEADAAIINYADYVRFDYNATPTEKTIILEKNYIGVDGKRYAGKITLLPFTSIILIEDRPY